MRCTEEVDTPDTFAMPRVLQCVASAGFVSSVLDDLLERLRSCVARRTGLSSRPSRRCLAKRSRHANGLARDAHSIGTARLFNPSRRSTISPLRIPA